LSSLSPCSALVVSANATRTARAQQWLPHAFEGISFAFADGMPAAHDLLDARRFDVLLLDRWAFTELCHREPEVMRVSPLPPVVVMAGHDDPEGAVEALRGGAQDVLDLQSESPSRIARCIRHAIERHRLLAELQIASERAQFAAQHDALTRLPNRHLFEEHMLRTIALAERNASRIALLYLDLDRFKGINDTLGHAAGDEVLIEVAERLAQVTRRSDLVARVGGDEFLVLATDVSGDRALSSVAERIQAALAEPFVIGGRDYWIGASIGIAVFPRDGDSPDMLLRHADLALYQAKAGGRGRTQFFSEELNRSVRRRHLVEQGLRRALDRGGLRIVYQPIFSAADREIVAAEALLRWNDPELGTVPPLEFIEAAEQSGLIVPLGDAVLRTACEQLAQWKHEGHRLRISVNLSAHQIDEEGLRRLISSALWDTGLDAGDLELEITESALMRDEQVAERTFGVLKQIGVGVTLDDFGTGYSSLNCLKRFPVDTVKIDRSFIRDLTVDSDDAAIVAAILAIARQLGLVVTAEGVETEDQLASLTEQSCPQIQGFLLSEPLSPEEFGALLRERRSGSPDRAAKRRSAATR
jgi:diguanylate cyclase (GGDEF)-like protein